IDRSSSAELTEAINAMYQYYKNAHVGLVYLADMAGGKSPEWSDDEAGSELIAPSDVHFYGADWKPLVGTHEAPSVAEALAERTGIPQSILTGSSAPSEWCYAARMSWAAHRTTTRIEDQAYCLLGIFDVSLPLVYGEGRRSNLRLQEGTIRRSTDQSIFAW
ncbi:hypothetical protein DOTSEDRAFT_93685, partial [Dothistroma septosporum NZE10]